MRDFRCEPAEDPELEAGEPAMMNDAPALRGAGMHAWHVEGLKLQGVHVRTLGGQAKQVLEGCRQVDGAIE